MKKLFLTIALVLTSILMNAQTQKMSNEFLRGQWTSNGQATEIWFNISDNNKLTIIEVSSYTGEPLTVIEHKIIGNAFYIKTVFEKLNFESTSTFTIINENTMALDVNSDYPGVVIYKRVINTNQ
jgi:hypothetical protein